MEEEQEEGLFCDVLTSESMRVLTAASRSRGDPTDSSVRMAQTEKMSWFCSPLYWTMPARLSMTSSMKDLTSMLLVPSRGVQVVKREASSPQLSSLSSWWGQR